MTLQELRREEKNLQRLLADARKRLHKAQDALEPLRAKAQSLSSSLAKVQSEIISELQKKVEAA